MTKLCILLGTRPEIIKLSPIIRCCEKNKLDYFIIHTNQHYSANMDKVFFEDLELPKAKYNLNIGSGTHADMTGKMLMKIEKVLIKEKPDMVFVQGDTNTVLAGALAASKLQIKIAHVEAGLRSYDREMPEETNRIITDHISDYLFAPTKLQKKILIKEGINKNKIFVTGNTIVDAVYQNLRISMKNRQTQRQNYALVTAHRPSNTDNKKNLENIFMALAFIHKKYNLEIIFPIHPRTKKMIQQFKIKIPNEIQLTEPVGYLEFLQLMKNAKIILTDSGGIQEESCIMKVPCITLRENTERPEALKVKSTVLAGANPRKIIDATNKMLKRKRNWENPFGDGKSSERMLRIIFSC